MPRLPRSRPCLDLLLACLACGLLVVAGAAHSAEPLATEPPAAEPLAAQPLTTQPPQFSLDVMAVLSKAGCNLGACHGNTNGKGGFKLSLRGEDPAADYAALVRAGSISGG